MRYRLPEGCGAVSFGGKQLAVADDGTVDLGAEAAAALLPHGIAPAETAGRPEAAPVTRPPSDRRPGR